MNKTVLYITFCILVALALIGAVLLMIVGIDPAPFFGQVVTLLGLVTVAAGTFYSLGKQGEKLATIESNTNGRLTSRDNEIKRLTNVLVGLGVNPDSPSTAAIHAVGEQVGDSAEALIAANEGSGRHVG